MLKKVFWFGVLVLASAAGLAGWFYWGGTTTLVLGQVELQKALEYGFPVEKTYLHLIKVDLSEPGLTLRESSDRISFSIKAVVGLPGIPKTLVGTAELSSLIRYDPAHGAFFADDPRIERMVIVGHPDGSLDSTQGALTWVLKGVLERTPLYSLKSEEARYALARLILKDVRVKEGKLRLTLGLAQ